MDEVELVVKQELEMFWSGFYYCPTTRQIREAIPGDDKLLCGCRRSNPKCVWERTEQTGVHVVRFLEQATTEAFMEQEKRIHSELYEMKLSRARMLLKAHD